MTTAPLAVVMARGLGSRMRREDLRATLGESQASVAALGVKGMIPDAKGRPFLDHLLSSLADAGIRDIVLVVAPDHAIIRNHYQAYPVTRLTLSFAVQREATGTADALLAAERLVGQRAFLVCNADNLYPVEALRALVDLTGPGVVAFDRGALVAQSNIEPQRIAAFARLAISDEDLLADILEKPDATEIHQASMNWIGMNLWRFDRAIFDACRDVPTSQRGERELPEAVALAVRRGMQIQVVRRLAGVLDLSSRSDIGEVMSRLDAATPQP